MINKRFRLFLQSGLFTIYKFPAGFCTFSCPSPNNPGGMYRLNANTVLTFRDALKIALSADKSKRETNASRA